MLLPNSLWLSKWRLMLSITKNDREMFTLASKFSDKLSEFPNKERGVLFSVRYYGFSPIRTVGKHFLLSTMYKSMLWVARKISMLLMVFFINRNALFSRDNLFPITFFAVQGWPYSILADRQYRYVYFRALPWSPSLDTIGREKGGGGGEWDPWTKYL